jgi:hypothetical protein
VRLVVVVVNVVVSEDMIIVDVVDGWLAIVGLREITNDECS